MPTHAVSSAAMSAMSPERNIALDGLRSLVILVLLIHFTDAVPFGPVGSVIFHAATGFAGVALDVFFVLSGFLITGVLLDAKRDPHFFRTFFIRRFLRIFPLYYGTLAVFIVILPAWLPAFANLRATGTQQLFYWGYLVNVLKALGGQALPSTGHFWSLSVEEQFYVVWPFAVSWLTLRRFRFLCGGLLVISPISRLALAYVFENTVAIYQFHRMDALALGAIIAVAGRSASGLSGVRHWIMALTLVTLGATIVAALVAPSVVADVVFTTTSAYLAAAFFLLVNEAPEGTVRFRVVRWRPFRIVGTYSYGIYVIHDPLADCLARFGILAMPTSAWQALGYCFIMVPVSVGVGALSWHLYERPILKLRPRLVYTGKKG